MFDVLGMTDDLENEYVARLDSLRSSVSQQAFTVQYCHPPVEYPSWFPADRP
jgi:hypothetical protein